MNATLNLSLDELLLSLRQKRIPIQFEIGTFVVLEACEAVIDSPVRVAGADVSINGEGRVLVSESAEKATTEESAGAFIEILCDLLLASAPGIPDVLLQLVENGPDDDRYTLSRLKDDLEAALVPLNRAATRRVLARLVREANQAVERRFAQPSFVGTRAELDAEFDTLLGQNESPPSHPTTAGIESNQANPSDSGKHASDSREDEPIGIDAELRRDSLYESDQKIQSDRETTRYDSAKRDGRPADKFYDNTNDFIDIKEQTKEKAPVTTRYGLAVFGLVILGVGYFVLAGQDDEDTRTSTKIESLSKDTTLKPQKVKEAPRLEQASQLKGVLRVSSTPSLAQVMRYVGRGLARVERVPLGVAHEFVAIADDYTPSRTVLAADARWRVKDGVSFTTLKMNLAPRKVRRGALDLGSTRLPRQRTTPTGKTGTVEIRTDPPEAAIYQLIGFTPDLAVENLSVDKPIRLLVYAAGYRVRHVDVNPTQWVEREGRLSATVDTELKRLE